MNSHTRLHTTGDKFVYATDNPTSTHPPDLAPPALTVLGTVSAFERAGWGASWLAHLFSQVPFETPRLTLVLG